MHTQICIDLIYNQIPLPCFAPKDINKLLFDYDAKNIPNMKIFSEINLFLSNQLFILHVCPNFHPIPYPMREIYPNTFNAALQLIDAFIHNLHYIIKRYFHTHFKVSGATDAHFYVSLMYLKEYFPLILYGSGLSIYLLKPEYTSGFSKNR